MNRIPGKPSELATCANRLFNFGLGKRYVSDMENGTIYIQIDLGPCRIVFQTYPGPGSFCARRRGVSTPPGVLRHLFTPANASDVLTSARSPYFKLGLAVIPIGADATSSGKPVYDIARVE